MASGTVNERDEGGWMQVTGGWHKSTPKDMDLVIDDPCYMYLSTQGLKWLKGGGDTLNGNTCMGNSQRNN